MAFPRLKCCRFLDRAASRDITVVQLFCRTRSSRMDFLPTFKLISGKPGEALWIMSLLLIGTSSILGGINFVTTILKMRVPSMT